MAFKVVLTRPAEADAAEYVNYLKERSGSERVLQDWLNGLDEMIDSLAEMPGKYQILDDDFSTSLEIRSAKYHSHRVLFHMDEQSNVVTVLRIFHYARDLKRAFR